MDEFPKEVSEEHFKKLQQEWDEGSTAELTEKIKSYRKTITEKFLQLSPGAKEFIFEFEDNVERPVWEKIMTELLERFPEKGFYYWRVIEYADVEKWARLDPSNLIKCYKYKIELR